MVHPSSKGRIRVDNSYWCYEPSQSVYLISLGGSNLKWRRLEHWWREYIESQNGYLAQNEHRRNKYQKVKPLE